MSGRWRWDAGLWAGLGLALVGCGELERGDGVFPGRAVVGFDGGLRDLGRGEDSGPVSERLEDATGVWALFVEDRKCLSAVGTQVESLIWTWYRLEVRADEPLSGEARVLRQVATLCSQELSPLIGGLRTVIPEAVIQALESRPWDAVLEGAAAGAGLVSASFVDLWGARRVVPGAPLPQEAEDPRVEDLDGDGAPGVTFVIGNAAGGEACRVSVVQRTSLRLAGAVVDSARLEGVVESDIDQVVLESSSALCGGSNAYVRSPTPSRFVMVRVDGQAGGLNLDLDGDGRVDCGEVVTGAQILEGPGMVGRGTPDNAVCR